MVEQSYIFDFSRVPSFFEYFNVAFFVDEMYQIIDGESKGTGSDCYELVWCSYGDGNNISDYLNSDGTLNSSVVTVHDTVDCALDYVRDEYGDATIGLHESVEFDIGDNNIPLKAIFLRNKSTGYVMGYCINLVSFTVTNKAVFDEDIVFWDITRLNNGG